MKKMKGSEFRKMVWAVVGEVNLHGISETTYPNRGSHAPLEVVFKVFANHTGE